MTKVYNLKDGDRKWYIVDGRGVILGRLATIIADVLTGKNKATYTSNMDSGDNVVVINVSKVKLSKDSKLTDKVYWRHSGYPGGIKKERFEEAMKKHPEKIIKRAVRGMLPKNKLQDPRMKRLKVFAGAEHTHTAQNPIKIELRPQRNAEIVTPQGKLVKE